jgi:F0F1-type ATP synthase epsilon subunit
MDSQFNTTERLKVEIYSTDKLVYSGEAFSLSAESEQGVFDVLPMHTNFVAILKNGISVNASDGKKYEFSSESSIIRVAANEVFIFLGV